MASLDVADCITEIKRICRIPDVTEYPASSDYYAMLRNAENRVKRDAGMLCPNALWGSPTLLTSADGGYTYTFGTDGGSNAIEPIGQVAIYRNKANIPFYPMVSNEEYVYESGKIRMTENVPRTFGDGPYAQFITPTYVIDGSSNTMTLPYQWRMCAVYDACAQYALSGGVLDPSPYQGLYAEELQRNVASARMNSTAGVIRFPRWQSGFHTNPYRFN